MKYKADEADMDMVKRRMETFCLKEEYLQLLQRLNDYTTVDVFNSFRANTNMEIDLFKKKLNRIPDIEMVDDKLERLQMYFNKSIKPLAMKEDCLKDKKNLKSLIDEVDTKIEMSNTDSSKMQRRTEIIEETLLMKTDKKET